MKITWGTKLVVFMAMFMGFIILMAVRMMKEDISLIQTDYYEKGENYQTTIDENKGVDSLIIFQFIQNNSESILAIKNLKSNPISNAKLQLIYLANKANDKEFDVQIIDSITTKFDLSNFEKGNWITRLNWSDKNGKHYSEKTFKIQ
ncbi:MAG: FixH family protein [Bacteroidia bacterium]